MSISFPNVTSFSTSYLLVILFLSTEHICFFLFFSIFCISPLLPKIEWCLSISNPIDCISSRGNLAHLLREIVICETIILMFLSLPYQGIHLSFPNKWNGTCKHLGIQAGLAAIFNKRWISQGVEISFFSYAHHQHRSARSISIRENGTRGLQ